VIKLDLTIPPSVNNIWNPVYKGYKKAAMVRSPEYNSWLNKAGFELLSQKPKGIKGKYNLSILFNDKIRGDLDNRIKPINDLLQKHGVIENDSMNKRLYVSISKAVEVGRCIVSVHVFVSDE
jgi:Holliday junction resolvase RusA-like endonuclease